MDCAYHIFRPLNPIANRASISFGSVSKNIHIGKVIKAKMKEKRIRPIDLRTELKLAKQSFYNIISRASIDTGMLQRISEAIGENFFFEFITQKDLQAKFNELNLVEATELEKVKMENEKLKAEKEQLKDEYITLMKELWQIEKKQKSGNFKIIENT